MKQFSGAKLAYIKEQGNPDNEGIALITSDEFERDLRQDYDVVEVIDILGDFTSWPTDRIMVQV